MQRKIGILMGGLSSEREVSIKTGSAVIKACEQLDYNVLVLQFEKNYKKFKSQMQDCDIIFNALHGGIGENGEVQNWMEKNNIKFTGSDSSSSSICMDKAKTKKILNSENIRTPSWEILKSTDDKTNIDLPLIVKPNDEGSTYGLRKVTKESELISAIHNAHGNGKKVLVEEFIQGRELTVTILDNKAYPIIEIKPVNLLYDYECKYSKGMAKFICPAILDFDIEKRIKSDTEKIFKILGCSVYGRADYILDKNNKHYFLEMNTLPGMTKTSLVPKSVAKVGLSFNELIERIIKLSL